MATNKTESKTIHNYLENMWHDYCLMNPEAFSIYKMLSQSGETIQNDHIALRTFKHPRLGINSLAKHFIKYGYYSAGEYFFVEKKLYAQHFEHADKSLPKIFISELELEKTSPYIQEIISGIINQIDPQMMASEDSVYGGKLWTINYQTYQKLAAESEYASWLYAYGFRPNHFTVSINHLKNFKDIAKLNIFIKERGYKLNTSGGEIKGTAEQLLEQSSTMASETVVQFGDGMYSIPACYYEFAKRYPMTNGELYQGFIAKSADKIFESTNKQS